jgi:tRNA (guanine-N7-)-methyltransferase
VDIGCAKGSWAIAMANSCPHMNFLGLEIRRPVVDLAMYRKKKENISNLHFLASNCNVDIPRILADINAITAIHMLTIQFPDPQFKSRHKKRRLVNEKFVLDLMANLACGTKIFLQSDVLDLMEDMVNTFLSCPAFSVSEGYCRDSLEANKSPFDILTEREIATLNKKLPVYRLLIERNSNYEEQHN